MKNGHPIHPLVELAHLEHSSGGKPKQKRSRKPKRYVIKLQSVSLTLERKPATERNKANG